MIIAEFEGVCKLGMPNPTLVDWIDITVFILAIIACFKSAKLAMLSEKNWWYRLSVILSLLVINKFLFIDFCVSQLFSSLARQVELYSLRRGFQALLVLSISVVLIVSSYQFQQKLSRYSVYLKWSYLACDGLIILMLLRLISLHQIDALLYIDWLGLGIGLNWIVEIICNALIILFACINIQQHQKFK
ncbi:MAG: hypothetical protein CTY10_01315 [Methylotenera sp.]|nr:MAG: hypothetical protein CTY10_01315 [Methylotenera sp.]